MKRSLFVILNLAFLFLQYSNGLAVESNDAHIKGTVSDSTSGEPLVGANIFIKETSLGTASNPDGEYSLLIPSGTYTLSVRFIGYKEKEVKLQLKDDQTLNLDIELAWAAIETDSIEITAQAQGQIGAINQQLSSNTITNVVSAARIQEIPDVNAAESVGRLPGVSIIRDAGEGQKVAIRGLSPKYNLVSVNGVRLAATDMSTENQSGSAFNGSYRSGDRSVDMSMISSNMLAGIEVQKANTADKDADVLGGIVDFKLKEAEEGFHTDILLQGGYNGQESSYNMFKFSGQVSNRFFDNKLGVIFQANYDKADRGSDRVNTSYFLNETASSGTHRVINIGKISLNDHSETRTRLGGSLLLDYKIGSGKIKINNFFNRLDREYVQRIRQFDLSELTQNRLLIDVRTQTDVMLNSIDFEYDLIGSQIDLGLSHSYSEITTPRQHGVFFTESGAIDPQADLRMQPKDIYQYILVKDYYDETQLDKIWFDERYSEERDITAHVDVKTLFRLSNTISGYVKFGGKYRHLTREYDQDGRFVSVWGGFGENARNAIRELYGDGLIMSTDDLVLPAITNWIDPNYDGSNFLDDYEIDIMPELEEMRRIHSVTNSTLLGDSWRTSGHDYEGNENISAGYIMSEINIGPDLMFLPGVRYERIETEYTAAQTSSQISQGQFAPVNSVTSNRVNDFWLPMVHLQYKPTDWFDVRLAYTKTITRPDYRDLQPWRDIRLDVVSLGNPELKPAESTNYDLHFSFYSNTIGLFTIGGFYKQIDDLIWSTQIGVVDSTDNIKYGVPASNSAPLTISVNNSDVAEVKGIEVEWQTNFWYLPSPLNGLVFSVNYSRIFSDNKYPQSILQITRRREGNRLILEKTRIDTYRVGRLVDQPNDIFNVSIGYDYSGFSIRLSYLFQGQTLSSLQRRSELDSFTKSYSRWDLNTKLQMPWEGLELFFNLVNISNEMDQRFQATEGKPTVLESYGLTGLLGLRYRM